MNQAELVEKISSQNDNTGTSKVSIKWVLDALAKVAQQEIKNGGEVTVHGLFKLSVSSRAARNGRNPKTGEPIVIAARNAPKFTALKALKDAAA